MYPEVMAEITRSDTDIQTEAIDTAIQETKIYLSRFDLVQLFGDDTAAPSVPAIAADGLLKKLVKAIAVWEIVKPCNANIALEKARADYDDAIRTLKLIQKGDGMPAWPYKDTTGETAPQGDSVYSSSNTKRNNDY